MEQEDYKEKLIALAEGLEIKFIDELIQLSPDHLRSLGKLMTSKIKKQRCVCGERLWRLLSLLNQYEDK